MSQVEVAQAIGVTYQQIQKYEAGNSRMSVATLLQFAELFGVPAESLFKGFGSGLKRSSADRQMAELVRAIAAIEDETTRVQVVAFVRRAAHANRNKHQRQTHKAD